MVDNQVLLFSKLEFFIIDDNEFVSEIWQNEEQIKELTHLRQLSLENLPSLKHLWKPMESHADKAAASKLQCFEVLEALSINDRPELKSLMMMTNNSRMSLKNLTRLDVVSCHALTNLMVPSSAKCLSQLETLNISNCQGMTEVIGLETDEEDQSEIVFGQLDTIRLNGLNNLRNFYSGKKSLTFPKLERLMVIECREMKSFSGGGTWVNAPMLEKIIVRSLHFCPRGRFGMVPEKAQVLDAGDVNAAIKKIWEDNNRTAPTAQ